MSDVYKSYLNGVRISPRKVRLVVDLIRGKHVQDALDILKFTNKRSAPILYKMVQSAIANATSQHSVDADSLMVDEAYVDGGATMKRFMPRAQGRAFVIRKRSSHITIKLKEI
jgi:large subunit ribosomal protein L22